MSPFSPPTTLKERGPGRYDLAVHPLVRAAQAAAAGAFLLGTLGSRDPFWLAGTAVCLLAALSEDRWILDSTRRLVQRRFGILPLPRTFELGWDEIEAVFLELVDRPSAENMAADPDSLRSLYPRLVGKSGRGWASWGFVLASGRDLAVRAEALSRGAAVRAQAGRVAEILGTPLLERRETFPA